MLGDINNDGIVDIRDYGIWRQHFGATDCGNVADLNGDCIVDIRDYGIWRQNFGQTGPTITPTSNATATSTTTPRPRTTPTATPTLPGRAYVANINSNSVTVIDTTTNAVVGPPFPWGASPRAWGWTRRSTAPSSPTGQQQRVGDRHDDQHRRGHSYPRGDNPVGVGVDPTVHRAYVTNLTATV